MGEIDRLYRDKLVLYERAIRQVEECITDIIKDFASDRDRLFRVARPVKPRVKSLNSLKRKAYEDSVPPEQVFERITDVAGIRVVVHNRTDAYKLLEKIKSSSKIHYDESSYEDKIVTPLESGYRAIHFIVHVDVEFKGTTCRIPCEVQVRTLLQDSWAVLAHEEIYKRSEDIPEVIQKLSRRFADQLAVLDDIAQDIRDELSKQVEPSGVAEDEEALTKRSLGVVLWEVFGEKAREHELQFALNELKDVGLSMVEDLNRFLPSEEVIARLDALHQEFFGGLTMSNMDKLVWGTKVMVTGERAYREFGRKVRSEWQEIERIARSEALSGLPETMEELIENLEGVHEVDVGFVDALKELGGISECDLCGEDIFEPDDAYEALSHHYNNKESPELLDLLYKMYADGVLECEDSGHSGLCSHCAHLLYSSNT